MVVANEGIDKERLKALLTTFFPKYRKEIVAAYLFGSLAEGTQSSLSDIDIAVLLQPRLDKKSTVVLKLRLYADLCRFLQRNDIDLVVLSLSGNLILNDHIVRHGVTLYSADEDAKTEFEVSVLHRCTDFKFQRHCAMGGVMERIRQKIGWINEHLSVIRSIKDDCDTKFVTDPVYRGALLHYLYLMADRVKRSSAVRL